MHTETSQAHDHYYYYYYYHGYYYFFYPNQTWTVFFLNTTQVGTQTG